MNKQAYVNGFVKRANEYGYTNEQALGFLKQSIDLGGLINSAKQIGGTVTSGLKDAGGTVADVADQARNMAVTSSPEYLKLLQDSTKQLQDSHGLLENMSQRMQNLTSENTGLSDQLAHHSSQDPINMLMAGGLGLGGGALLHKLLGKKKHPEQQQ